MGVTWAAAWALAGLALGLASLLLSGLPWETVFQLFDAPLPALALPGFVGGVLFSAVLGVAGRRHRFGALSLPRFTAWGALGGCLLSFVPGLLVAAGLATPGPGSPGIGALTAILVVPLALLGAVSAAGSLALARLGEDREPGAAGEAVARAGLTAREERERLGDGSAGRGAARPAVRPRSEEGDASG
jgi:hypothetical protein